MEIKEVNNEHGAVVYHVEDMGVIQEFWSLKSAQEFVNYFKGST